MAEAPDRHDRYQRPLGAAEENALDREEVRILWDFVHGDIMDSRIRARLNAHRGMCTRHAWGYVLVEIELWQSGAGKRAGHQPFDVSILYADLLATMTGLLRRKHRRGWPKVLQGQGSCVICDDLRGPLPSGSIVTHAGFNSEVLAQEANRMDHLRDWLKQTRGHWVPEVCPECSREVTGVSRAGGTRCRIHLITMAELDEPLMHATVARLTVLRDRLLALTDSMTQEGLESTPDVDASWILAMAWFHGWSFPLALEPVDGCP